MRLDGVVQTGVPVVPGGRDGGLDEGPERVPGAKVVQDSHQNKTDHQDQSSHKEPH